MSSEFRYKIILLCGGIGSGKSVVSGYLRTRGVPVYDSDNAAKHLYIEDESLICDIELALGISMMDSGGRLDTKVLSQRVFSDPKALSLLESIVHPAVLKDFLRWKASLRGRPWQGYCGEVPFAVMESAIALEKPLFAGCFDAVAFVDAPQNERLRWACQRDGVPQEKILARIAAQRLDPSRADVLIVNDSTLEQLYRKTDEAFETLTGGL